VTLALVTALLLAAPAAAHRLSGVVVDQNDASRAGAVVDVMGPRKLVMLTDDQGRFEIDLPSGTYTVRVRVDGRRQEFLVTVGDADLSRTFELPW